MSTKWQWEAGRCIQQVADQVKTTLSDAIAEKFPQFSPETLADLPINWQPVLKGPVMTIGYGAGKEGMLA